MPDLIGSILFGLFSLGALGFGTVLVVQRNPARGAIAFAFVILSTCGLFLLLAAPFLMAVTIIIYAGAIIVTFLFVLMLSQVSGPSNENDRSGEPLFGSLAGFAFAGLVLFTLYLTALGNSPAEADSVAAQALPVAVLTNEERQSLASAIAKLDAADEQLVGEPNSNARRVEYFEGIKNELAPVVGSNQGSRSGSIRARLERTPGRSNESIVPYRLDAQAGEVLARAKRVRDRNEAAFATIETHLLEGKPDASQAKDELNKLRAETLLLYGSGELPAHNVSNIGYTLYADRLLAVELAGTLLLVATIGAVAIAQRKGAAA
jgi:NADH:ubiquinone oxidoreductase subunit 6 (subunit J)